MILQYTFNMWDKEFGRIAKKNHAMLVKCGFQKIKLPQPICNACDADLENSYSIDPNGNIYKCIAGIGSNDEILGSLHHNGSIVYNREEQNKYRNWSVFDDHECCNCKLLSLCMGGCLRAWFKLDNQKGKICYQNKNIQQVKNRIISYYNATKSS